MIANTELPEFVLAFLLLRLGDLYQLVDMFPLRLLVDFNFLLRAFWQLIESIPP